MVTFLTVLSGVCWTVVYLNAVRVGFREKADAIPFIALALNITWEGLYSYVFLAHDLTNVQGWINLVWFGVDILLLAVYLRFGRKEWAETIAPTRYFAPWTILVFAMSMALQLVFWKGFPVVDYGSSNIYHHLYLGAAYAAFLQNLLMSGLFILMFIRRRGGLGQNPVIAVSKFVGTLAPTLVYALWFHNPVIAVIGAFTAVLDLTYIWLLAIGPRFFVEGGTASVHRAAPEAPAVPAVPAVTVS